MEDETEDEMEDETEDETEDAEKVKRSKVTFDLLQYEQMEDDIPKDFIRDAIIDNKPLYIIDNKPLYNVRARTIIYRIFNI